MSAYDIRGMAGDVRGLNAVERELVRAREKFPKINSPHEGYAVIAEELDEFWGQVKAKASDRDPIAMRHELEQIAAMAIRTASDVLRDFEWDSNPTATTPAAADEGSQG